MGTRLYPNTENTNVIERLAGVRQGTSDSLDSIEKGFARRREQLMSEIRLWNVSSWQYDAKLQEVVSLDQEEHDSLNKDQRELKNFRTFGWGRVVWQSPKRGFSPSGEITEYEEVEEMTWENNCDLRGVEISELEGVHWS